jgi:hypothetical protein
MRTDWTRADSSVVDEGIDMPVEPVPNSLDRMADGCLVGHIRNDGLGYSARLSDRLYKFGHCALVPIQAGD